MSRRVSVFRSATSRALEDQTFEVICSCGEVVSGTRQVQAQAIVCPQCGKRLFVLPADAYAGAVPPSTRPSNFVGGSSSGRVIDKLNRLAFWTRLRERRTNLGRRLGSIASRTGRWLKSRFPTFGG